MAYLLFRPITANRKTGYQVRDVFGCSLDLPDTIDMAP